MEIGEEQIEEAAALVKAIRGLCDGHTINAVRLAPVNFAVSVIVSDARGLDEAKVVAEAIAKTINVQIETRWNTNHKGLQ